MKSFIIYIGMMIIVFAVTLGGSSLLAGFVKDNELVEPEPGVHCIVVSRIMNTSVDCWKVDQ